MSKPTNPRSSFRASTATVVLLASALLLLPSCKKPGDEPSEVLKLSGDEVAALLGLKERADVKVGDVESGRDGVKVRSVSLRGADDGTEVEVADVELRITSPARLKYAIASLRVGKLDVLDWKTTQRAQAFDVRVEKPGPGFLSKLEAAVAAARSGGPLRTAALSCERLTIDRITYVARAADASLTKVNVEKLSIVDATAEAVGEFGVASAGIGDRVTGRGLKLTKIDRRWADQLLGLLTRTDAGLGGPATVPAVATARPPVGSASPPPAAGAAPPEVPPPPAAKPDDKPPVLDDRLFPFDHFEVAGLDLDLGKLFDAPAGVATVTGVRLDVRRGPNGRLVGLAGGADVVVPTAALGEGAPAFFRAVGGAALERALSLNLSVRSDRDPDRPTERSTVTLAAPGAITLTVSATTRQLSEALAALLTRQAMPEDYVTLASVAVDGRDEGLFAYVLSDRYAGAAEVKGGLEEVAFKLGPPTDDARVLGELAGFVRAPKGFAWTAGSADRFLAVRDFLNEVDPVGGGRRVPAFASRVSFAHAAPPAGAAPSTPDAAAVRAEAAAYTAAALKGWYGRRYLSAHAMDRFAGWRRAAEGGDPAAALLVGACYDLGHGVRPDRAEALRWFRRAADAGDAAAMVRVGERLDNRYGGDGRPGDRTEAMRWYQKAADAGDAEGMRCVAAVYDDKFDRAQAEAWYGRAAEAGSVAAMVKLGRWRWSGYGGDRDCPAAVRWYRRAADAGSREAMNNLAESYAAGGPGVPKDPAEAARWQRMAAEAEPAPPFPFK